MSPGIVDENTCFTVEAIQKSICHHLSYKTLLIYITLDFQNEYDFYDFSCHC